MPVSLTTHNVAFNSPSDFEVFQQTVHALAEKSGLERTDYEFEVLGLAEADDGGWKARLRTDLTQDHLKVAAAQVGPRSTINVFTFTVLTRREEDDQ